MRIDSQFIRIAGKRHHHITLDPDPGVPVKMVCLFTHGQGDYAERYAEVLQPFTHRGIRCLLTDLRGHGRSPGKRGHLRLRDIDAVLQHNLELAGQLPVGIAGHSMGGLLTLRHLALSLTGDLPVPEFCWVNGPLLRPANGHPDWFVNVAHKIAKLLPRTTIDTKVTAEQCSRGEEGDDRVPKLGELGHQRVSLGWGSQLIEISTFVHSTLGSHSYDKPFLLTQGLDDQICPPPFAHQFFQELQWPKKHWIGLEDMRHETFAEPNREILYQSISHWLDGFS